MTQPTMRFLTPQNDLLDFARARVLIVGDVMLDSYWHGPTSRISPEAPVPVVKIDLEESRVGGAGNVALNAAVLGARTHILGLVGHDSAAELIESILLDSGVSCHFQRVGGSRTITKLRVLSRHQQLIRLDFEDDFSNWNANALFDEFVARLPATDAVILSDYSKGVLRRCDELVAAARKLGKPIIVDPKGTDFERYRGATLITPNLAEFEAVVGYCATEDEIVRRGENLRDALDLDAVLVTRSEKGMTLLERGHRPLHLATRAQEVFDVTGAGDTVVATLGTALAAGIPLADAVSLSNIAAGIVVAKLGTATVSRSELSAVLNGSLHAESSGICDEKKLLARIGEARVSGARIVMTNGCFDILHPGHIDYLEKARALGDRLVVAVNDCASVRRLKGDSRPINALDTRMRMLSALACVDWVVPFSDDTPERLYCNVLPDIVVKGGDYSESEISGAECVKAAGGHARILDFLPGYSTTSLIKKIQRGSM